MNYAGTLRPTTIIQPPTGQRTTMHLDGTTRDIIRTIMHADGQSAQYIRASNLRRLRGRNDYATLRNIYQFVKDNVQYRPDRSGHEIVRSPGYLMASRQGDCKSLSVAIGALCRAFGIPYHYRFIRQKGAHNLHHVYVVANAPDASSPRRAVVLDAVHTAFDREPAYAERVDLTPGQRVPPGIHGIGEASGPGVNFWAASMPLILIIVAWLAFSEPTSKRKKSRA